jgi:integrase
MGFIEKRPGEAGYRARFRDPLGEQRSKTFARKADAQRFLYEMETDKARGTWIDPRGAEMPLATWAEEFLRLCRRLSPTTLETYRRDLGKYVLPRFGAYRLGSIPADEIENWLNDEIDAGIAPSSAHRHYRTLRRMLQVAVDKQKILVNPCTRVQPPRVPKREMAFLGWDDAISLAEAHNGRYRALIYVAVDSGMRWSELVGLRRSKVDTVNCKIRVIDQLVRLANGSFLRKEPKTAAAVRSITISPFTAGVLSGHMDMITRTAPDALVFTNGAGNPLSAASFLSNHFARAQERAGIACRFHDLRHTSVALAIAAGAHPKAIQSRMGHSSINVTLDRYGHLFPELDEAIAEAFDQSLQEAARRWAATRPSHGPVLDDEAATS